MSGTSLLRQNFFEGPQKDLSLRSDGHLTLAPQSRELDSTSVPYLWAIARDSKDTVYYAGGAPTGATTKIFALAPGAKPRLFAEVTGLEIHSLAVDAQDRVYAAVLPDAKIYRIDASGKPQLFFDPKCKYVWAMAFDRTGNLFVATGDSGIIYRVTPEGKGTQFFDSEETHARSMILDKDGNLIVGTEPSGLVLRINPKGESFVLYETSKREVTAVAEHEGLLYATAVGNKTGAATVTGAAPVLPSNPAPTSPTGAPRSGANPPSLPPPVGSLSVSVAGGSEVYRIAKDGYTERIWSSPTELAYAIAFDPSGKPLDRHRQQGSHLSHRFRPTLHPAAQHASNAGHSIASR
jgi:sugar lactone lactonase YvrE